MSICKQYYIYDNYDLGSKSPFNIVSLKAKKKNKNKKFNVLGAC